MLKKLVQLKENVSGLVQPLVQPLVQSKDPALGTQFLEAVRTGQPVVISSVVSRKPDLDFQDPETGFSAIHIVVERNDLATFNYLITLGVKPNLKDKNGNTPLMQATELNRQRLIKELTTRKDCGFGLANAAGETSINIALRSNQVKVARFLLDAGEEVDRAMRFAVQQENWEQINWLANHKGNVNITDSQNTSGLVRAIQSGSLEKVQRWVELGADINFKHGSGALLRMAGWTPLMVAIECGRVDIIQYLYRQPNIDLKLRSDSQASALSIAVSRGNIELAKAFDRRGLDFYQVTNEGMTILMFAAQSGDLKTMEYILDKVPAQLNAQDNIGWTALMYAIKASAPDVVSYLLAKGADKSLQSRDHKFSAIRVATIQKSRVSPTSPDDLRRAEDVIRILSA